MDETIGRSSSEDVDAPDGIEASNGVGAVEATEIEPDPAATTDPLPIDTVDGSDPDVAAQADLDKLDAYRDAEALDTPELRRADGRRRRRTAIAIVVVALLAGAAGMLIGSRIQSPADRAAERAAPVASLITVPVEYRELSSELVLNGEVAFNAPFVISLAGPVGIDTGDNAVITKALQPEAAITEGSVLLEVTGRPVFALQGQLPMYRRMVIGTEGPDVTQLEEALVRLGYPVGEGADPVFDADTATALEQLYADAGYDPQGPTDDQAGEIESAREAVTAAEETLRSARDAAATASRPIAESERLQLQRNLDEARAAVPDAEDALGRERENQNGAVQVAQSEVDSARAALTTAQIALDNARNGALDPDTGAPYTPARINELDAEVSGARESVTRAESGLQTANNDRTAAIDAAEKAIDDARFNVELAEAQFNEQTSTATDPVLNEQVTTAEEELAAAQTKLSNLEATTGTMLSPGEIVFAPVLPSTVTESYVTLGTAAEGQLGAMATSETLVRARVSRVDSGLVAVGANVAIEVRDAGVEMTGTVLSVGVSEPTESGQEGVLPTQDSGRLEVVIEPDGELNQYVYYGARVRVTIGATDGEVLVVPVAALTVGPGEQDQIEIEIEAATAEVEAVTKIVPVEVGLSANGLAEVSPVEAGALVEGDRVVIGFEWSDRQVDDGRDASNATDVGSDDENADGGDGDGDSGSDADDDSGSSDESPLSAILGYSDDPVAQREQELAIQEAVVECMQAEGFEYQPVDYSAQFGAETAEMPGTDEFGEKYGYGVMYFYELYELNPDESGGFQFEDPNQEYVSSLGQTEQEAYFAALYGDQEDVMSEGDDVYVAPPIEQQGCEGKARFEVVGADPWADPEISQSLDDYFQSLENDPGMSERNDEWLVCMQPTLEGIDTDVDATRPDDMYQVFDMMKAVATGQEVIAVNSQAEVDEYFNSGDAVGGAMFNEDGTGHVYVGEQTPIDGAEIDRLTALEVEVWAADQACQDEVGLPEYRRQLEQQTADSLLEQFPELGD